MIAYRRNDRKYDSVAKVGRLIHFDNRLENNAVIIEASFDGTLRKVRWRISANGPSDVRAQLDYEYSLDSVVDILGVQFSSNPEQIRLLRWLGLGPYRVWQNRLQGTRLDVFENRSSKATFAICIGRGLLRAPGHSRFQQGYRVLILVCLSRKTALTVCSIFQMLALQLWTIFLR